MFIVPNLPPVEAVPPHPPLQDDPLGESLLWSCLVAILPLIGHRPTCCPFLEGISRPPSRVAIWTLSKIQGMDLEITTAAALRGHSRGHSSPKKITALPSNRMVNTSIELINTSIELINTSIELINTSIETYVALAFSFMHALNIMFTSPQAITQSLAVML